jgi:hypothetical protein
MKQTYAVFEMREWQRGFRPVEVFSDLAGAKDFARKLKEGFYVYPENAGQNLDWRVYERTETDWKILPNN